MEQLVATSLGNARLTVDVAENPHAVLWLGHGAGGGIGGADLTAIARDLPARGVTVIRHEQPWRLAGKRVAARPPVLDVGWLESLPAVRDLAAELPIVAGGRSAGARVACRTAAQVGAAGVVCLGFPLRPPGSPERSRLAELLTPEVPVLVLQGERDTFGTARQLADEAAGSPRVRVVVVPGADHSMKVLARSPLPPRQVLAGITAEIAAFVADVTAS